MSVDKQIPTYDKWSDWLSFPDPRKGEYIYAPLGPGVYEVRHKTTGEFILFGSGKTVAYRMSSLLPFPCGSGHRSNEEKRKYIYANIAELEYRTVPCLSETEARKIEASLKSGGKNYRFPK